MPIDLESGKEFLWVAREATAGAVAGFATDSIFFGLDSYKTMNQVEAKQVKVSRLFRGLLPVTLMGTAPSVGCFFAIYELTKQIAAEQGLSVSSSVFVASLLGAFPASLVAVPSDVVKKRLNLGLAQTPIEAVTQAISIHRGLGGLMVGWQANMGKDIPFAVFKLTLFEAFVRQLESMDSWRIGSSRGEPAGPYERTACGLLSGAATAVITNPLDVVNTRMKASSQTGVVMAEMAATVVRREGLSALFFAGLGPRMAIIGLGSGVFWGAHGHCRRALGLDDPPASPTSGFRKD
mmetsp:Transcript_48848/g.98296  ORF Transcript_48848/g.98296 Transcript_48848/m.98296 type:complete len:293 (+) Transcript_48848:59-937(+)